ncbi:MAG TPA: hypothetical protein ENJ09_04895 [Planctomycetes bacterium]|nr:hypothetical protein [Planctomycetota bacterium]
MPPRPHRMQRTGLLTALTLLAATSCGGGGSEPRWIDLTVGYQPPPLAEVAAKWAGAETSTSVVTDADGTWVVAELDPGAWEKEDRPGAWSIERPWSGRFACAGNGATRLEVDGRELSLGQRRAQDIEGLYFVKEGRLFIAVENGGERPKSAHYRLKADQGRAEGGRWRISTLDHTGFGIPVWDGAPATVETTIPPGSALHFTTVFERLPHGLAEETTAPHPTATFRVLLDGEEIFEGGGLGNGEGQRIALPPSGRRTATLRFEIEGGPGRGVFFAPELAPAEVGSYRARPWGRGRPNLTLFIADTFRADNLAIYGGDPELTPELNALADRSVRFLAAHSAAAWTLPAISSILTGLFPPQHGAWRKDRTLPRALSTIAEVMHDAGYRTVAVTDSGFFSPPYGLDQGFDLFFENRIHHWNMNKTVDQALAAIDHDDGRPLFLLVHTYRAHGPFRTGPEEDESAYNEFLKKGAEILAATPDDEGVLQTRKDALIPYLDEWVGLYHSGVHDLDFKFGRFLRGFEERGLLETGYLAFCGDHGQAHGENHDVAHGGKLWETKLRVPLLLAGADLDPHDVTSVVSTLDLPPTFAQLAGIAPEADWAGHSLLDPAIDRTAFAFRFETEGSEEVTILEGDRKVFTRPNAAALEAGKTISAYDLGNDPLEEHDIDNEPWASELVREMASAVEGYLAEKAAQGSGEDAARMSGDLGDIGYTGDE